MGFDDGRIVLDRENGAYFCGEIVKGRLEFVLTKNKTFRGIYVDFRGFCKVHWTTSHSRRENDKTVHYTVTHESNEDYVNVTTYLVGSKNGEHQLAPGSHVFPFQFQIPSHCPASFEGSDGHVRYHVKVTVDRAFKMDQHKTAQLRVIAPLDLNTNPYCNEAIGMEFYQSYCCWCLSAGKSEVVVKVPAGGACPRQVIPVEVACKNDSNVEIKAIKLEIKKDVTFHAQREPDTRHNRDIILEVKKGPIPGRTQRNWVVELEIPDMDVHNMIGCRFIDIDFTFKVKIVTAGCHQNEDESRPFIIGTIPLSAFPIKSLVPTENTTVSHGISSFPPMMNQPITGNLPYPNAPGIGINPPQINPFPSPYPNQPQPGANPPYPNTSPYPLNPIPPYPTTNAPYPTSQGASPFSAPNAPYATESGAPYPNVSPYPPNSSPYPPNTSPYPPNTSPYPPSVPYGNSPREFTGTALKTENFGNTAQGNVKDGVTMPLLPPPAGVPYTTSPYASASAPVPSTPNDEGNKFYDDLPTNNSPYNPEYSDKNYGK